jgi:hypothetical protein
MLENQSIEKLDAVFDKAIVVMGILAAAELAYLLSLPSQKDQNLQALLNAFKIFTLIETTVPFLIIVSLFMIKQLFVKTTHEPKSIVLTLVSWDFWAWSMWTILYMFVGILFASLDYPVYYTIIVAVLTWGIFLLFTFRISKAYSSCFDMHYFPNSEKYLLKKFNSISFAAMFLSFSIYSLLAFLALGVFIKLSI